MDTDTADAPEATEAVTAVVPRRRFPWAVLLIVYTLVRIKANVGVLLSSDRLLVDLYGGPFGMKNPVKLYTHTPNGLIALAMVDGLLRPLITGLGVYSFIGDNFHADNSLHVWSWRLSLALASFLADPALLLSIPASTWTFIMLYCYFLGVHLVLIHLVNLKLHAVYPAFSPKLGSVCAIFCAGAFVPLVAVGVMAAQAVVLSVAACTNRSLRFATFLYIATVVALLGRCVVNLQGGLHTHEDAYVFSTPVDARGLDGHLYLLTPYALLQTETVLALSGISSSLMQRLRNCRKGLVRGLGGEVRESDFAITGKRITVLGHTNNASRHCICSFPGKYGDLWDDAASSTSFNRYACSLACVFLTDQDSGLGRHAEKPDLPGGCWCHTIYGPLTPDAYLSEVEETSSSHDEIAFKRADAEAMGQIFLLKTLMDEHVEQAWSQKKAEAKRQAEERCRENDEKAPWGCLWLQVWMRNIDIAKVSRLALYALILQTKPPRSGKAEFYLLP